MCLVPISRKTSRNVRYGSRGGPAGTNDPLRPTGYWPRAARHTAEIPTPACRAAAARLMPWLANSSASAIRLSRSGRLEMVYCIRLPGCLVRTYPSSRIWSRISSSAHVRPAAPAVPSPNQQPKVYGAIGNACSGYSSGRQTSTAWLVHDPPRAETRSDCAISAVVTGRSSCDRRRPERPAARTRRHNRKNTSELQSPVHLVCRLLLEKKHRGTVRPNATNLNAKHKQYHNKQSKNI